MYPNLSLHLNDRKHLQNCYLFQFLRKTESALLILQLSDQKLMTIQFVKLLCLNNNFRTTSTNIFKVAVLLKLQRKLNLI